MAIYCCPLLADFLEENDFTELTTDAFVGGEETSGRTTNGDLGCITEVTPEQIVYVTIQVCRRNIYAHEHV